MKLAFVQRACRSKTNFEVRDINIENDETRENRVCKIFTKVNAMGGRDMKLDLFDSSLDLVSFPLVSELKR